jgi:hypothetical protein
MSNYEEKKQAKIDYYKSKSEKLTIESDNLFNTAHELASIIPFGQPILVGHHSERGHRNLIKKINTKKREYGF